MSELVAVARANVERGRSEQAVARSAFLPEVSASAGYVRTLRSEFDGLVPPA